MSATEVAGHRIGLVVRRPVAPFTGGTFVIRRVSNPRSELVDLDEDQVRRRARRDPRRSDRRGAGSGHDPCAHVALPPVCCVKQVN